MMADQLVVMKVDHWVEMMVEKTAVRKVASSAGATEQSSVVKLGLPLAVN